MKKNLFVALALFLGLSITSCQKSADQPKADGAQEATTETVAEAPADDNGMPTELGQLIEKAKAEGNSWTEDQWKAAITNCLKAALPMVKFIEEMTKTMEKDPVAAAEMIEKAEKEHPEYKVIEKQLDEFEEITEKSEVASKLMNSVFLKKVKAEIGFPEEI